MHVCMVLPLLLPPCMPADRDMYANSSDPMLIVGKSGRILDCNGAALHLFRARSRADLINRRTRVSQPGGTVSCTQRLTIAVRAEANG